MAREKGWVSGGVGPANALLSQSEAHLAGGFGYKPKITPYSILLLPQQLHSLAPLHGACLALLPLGAAPLPPRGQAGIPGALSSP